MSRSSRLHSLRRPFSCAGRPRGREPVAIGPVLPGVHVAGIGCGAYHGGTARERQATTGRPGVNVHTASRRTARAELLPEGKHKLRTVAEKDRVRAPSLTYCGASQARAAV